MPLELLATLAILLPGFAAVLAAAVGYILPGHASEKTAQPRAIHHEQDARHSITAASAHHAEHDDHDAHAAAHHHGVEGSKTSLADRAAMAITCTGVITAAILSWIVFFTLWHTPAATSVDWFTWISSGTWSVAFGALVDKLSATMFIVVTTVSACVHVYSTAYMADDPSKRRFFIYLSCFTLAMLLLVSAPNLLQMFLGWEGVGVCSYLLIGFWHHKESANAAAMKAFIVNRVADAALLMGMFTLLMSFGTLNYAELLPNVGQFASATLELFGHTFRLLDVAALLIFIGAMGKSAQFGLHTWLPDAMEGPTPVSALIHAATMVTAGVFLLCRLSPLYEATPDVLQIVAWVGALTAIFAATVGLTQRDIKRVIAYSTCSQLGYMFFAIGVSAYPAAMFHLTTHAFFKALLFLGAGSVIHGMHHEQDIFRMGALRKLMPVTYACMWLGSLALAGIPPFAGFFSKDLILESAFAQGSYGPYIYAVGTCAALLTAIYGFRIVFMAFNGRFNAPDDQHAVDAYHHAHESPWLMIGPMLPLAFGAVFAGWLLAPMSHLDWWHGAIAISAAHPALEHAHHTPAWVASLPLLLALCGIALAWYLFAEYRTIPRRLAANVRPLYLVSFNKWYIDDLYHQLWVRPTAALGKIFQLNDRAVIDGTINGTAAGITDLGRLVKPLQSGYLYHYAFTMLIALTLGLGWLLWTAAH